MTRKIDIVVTKDVFNEKGHNCFECQPYVKGERLFKGCLPECRPDHKVRLGDAFHQQGCPNIGANVSGQ